MTILRDEWQGMYPSNWKGLVVPDSIKHPAKFSSKLIRHIYEHMLEEGWLQPGDVVLDPFGGVALGAFDAQRLGLRWRGIELEARFADLGNANIALWNKRFSRMPHWERDAVLFQGDSRKLLEILQVAEGAVSSPPYSGARIGGPESMRRSNDANGDYGNTEGQLGAMPIGNLDAALSSPPYADSMERKGGFDPEKSKYKGGPNSNISNDDTGYTDVAGLVSSPPYAEARIGQESGQEQCGHGDQYGATPGQLGAMKSDGFDAALASPPFTDVSANANRPNKLLPEYIAKYGYKNLHGDYGATEGQLGAMKSDGFDQAVSSPPFLQARGGTPEPKGGAIDAALYQRHSAGNASAHGYGESEGQLSSMQDGDFEGAVSSPPYESSPVNDAQRSSRHHDQDGAMTGPVPYGITEGQLGNNHGDSFWLSARQIVDQVYAALRPGAHCVWVLKAFVKNKVVIDFPGQWQQLCEAAGFRTVHVHHALLTNHRGASYTLDGALVEHKTEAKSFFRRNGEQKARAAKWWETCGLSRQCQADWLWAAHDLKWRQWHQDLAKHPDRKIKPPKAFIIRGKAQSMAYAEAGAPEVEIPTSIDFETVLCMVKEA